VIWFACSILRLKVVQCFGLHAVFLDTRLSSALVCMQYSSNQGCQVIWFACSILRHKVVQCFGVTVAHPNTRFLCLHNHIIYVQNILLSNIKSTILNILDLKELKIIILFGKQFLFAWVNGFEELNFNKENIKIIKSITLFW
jgi:hypothetical protein